ncbi:hypothetical protein MPHL43072_14345 [Mycolicibacterium phlei DSM 43072]|uniref:Uncharacterized protein n=2 Tax=Mycolicibacterium phlei TaxID=1771 RepID=A0A5N5V793_MYCPH|nr:hypothetical protein MPHL21000_06330 [Mycolicibacterium phlei DSM 43239 = CCUG 21000]KXW61374.1 hypothetical protein MPHL43239_21850 [Mycolicibacterium phlei DSM 43239 = CCUG 21000]KXW63771.1 hypothetical protein MPHL43070_05925 [Mycolicibacterium phlei DSM 43070]KXW72103.1 hypothetical protein MPHL43072_14345 [Mycolicibacterium phlei DSM 43072]KXW79118.1 hypothetical protein JL15_02375 [Mycolicibacterium phlei DSM 43071]
MSATELIQGRGIGDFMTIRHILVDEAQDLTGIRADFVLKLLEVADCGFTIFVDQAQAIYDFASGEFENSPSFVERVEAVYTSGVETRTLSSNFRTTDPQLLTIAGLGELIRNSEAKREDVAEKFRREMQKLPAAGSVDGAAQLLCVANDTAVLTRRNNEALAVSAALYNAGVKHQFRRRADDPVVGSWLSRLSSRIASTRLTRADLEEDESILPWPAQVTWGALSRVSPPRRGAINLEAVADRLALNMPPDELIDTNTGEVVVSSIHRSKGLEFTTVLLIPFEIPEDDWLQEARILYVGLTRAKQNLMALQPVDDRRWSFLQGANRWRRIGFAGKRTYTTGIEVTGSDAFSFDATGVLRPQRDPAELIDYLHTEVHAGDTVTLIRRVTDAVYDVLHEGNWVAVTTPGFGELVNNRLGLKNPPARIDGCRVETLSTVALSTQAAELLGVSTRLVPNCRIQGVGTW